MNPESIARARAEYLRLDEETSQAYTAAYNHHRDIGANGEYYSLLAIAYDLNDKKNAARAAYENQIGAKL